MRKNILITGASGLVATELTIQLLANSNYNLILVTRDKDSLKDRYTDYQSRVLKCTLDEIISDSSLKFQACVHTAFTRSSEGTNIVSSLDFLKRLCYLCKERKVGKFINISSQSVYGDDYTPGITEEGICAPSYMYALGKYSSELICQQAFTNTPTELFNVRLSSVCENARFVKIFVSNALNDIPIVLTAPNQTVSFIDVRDVADALSLIVSDDNITPGIYNLGSGIWSSISHVASLVKKIGESHYHTPNVSIEINDSGKTTQMGMDITKIKTTLGWHPKYDFDSMVISIFEMLTNVNGGGTHKALI